MENPNQSLYCLRYKGQFGDSSGLTNPQDENLNGKVYRCSPPCIPVHWPVSPQAGMPINRMHNTSYFETKYCKMQSRMNAFYIEPNIASPIQYVSRTSGIAMTVAFLFVIRYTATFVLFLSTLFTMFNTIFFNGVHEGYAVVLKQSGAKFKAVVKIAENYIHYAKKYKAR